MMAVAQLTLDGRFVAIYYNTVEAGLALGVEPSGIYKVQRGQRKKANGFFWVAIRHLHRIQVGQFRHRSDKEKKYQLAYQAKRRKENRDAYNAYHREYRRKNNAMTLASSRRWKEKTGYNKAERKRRAASQ